MYGVVPRVFPSTTTDAPLGVEEITILFLDAVDRVGVLRGVERLEVGRLLRRVDAVRVGELLVSSLATSFSSSASASACAVSAAAESVSVDICGISADGFSADAVCSADFAPLPIKVR